MGVFTGLNHFLTKLISFLKKVYIKNRRFSLYEIFKIFRVKVKEDEIFERSLAVAFGFTLATFPFIIFLFALIPYVTHFIPEIDSNRIMQFLFNVMPKNMYEIAKETILDLISTKRGGLLSVGVLAALFLSTNGFHTLIKTFNSCHKVTENRSLFKTRLTALLLTLIFSLVTIFAITLATIGDFFLFWLGQRELLLYGFDRYFIILSQSVILFITFYLGITSLYYFAPAVHNKWTFFSSGSMIAAVGCVTSSLIFSYYINHFPTYNKIYGSIGVLIALMGWIYIISCILLIGFEWNSSIDLAMKDTKNKKVL